MRARTVLPGVLLIALASTLTLRAQPSGPPSKTPDQPTLPPLLVWESMSDSPQRLPTDIAQLFDVLHRAGQLPLAEYLDGKGLPVEALLRERNLMHGPFFPVQLDALLCRLNSHVCQSAGGAAAGRWTNQAGDTLRLPALDFELVRRPMQFTKSRGQKMRDVVIGARQGCVEYDDECRGYVAYLNGVEVGDLDRLEGGIQVPTLTVRTRLSPNLPVDARRALASNLVAWAQFKTQSGRLKGGGAVDAAATDEPLFDRQREVFALVRHPLSTGSPPMPDASGITVGIVDNAFSLAGHCDFEEGRFDGRCDEAADARALDHGMHVAGIIAARRNGRGLLGMSPSVRLAATPFFVQQVGNTVAFSDALGQLVASHRPQVVNLSLEYRPISSAQGDKIEEAIRNLRRAVLFVAAAGNAHADKSHVCDVRPACFDFPNVITVAALDRQPDDPQLWQGSDEGSNWGERFHVAAPGDAILSTLPGNRVGVMSGTSQAAPMVTAAASLLFALDAKLTPQQVKRRLIATSDLLPRLDRVLLGGRLNVERALLGIQDDEDLVWTEDSPAPLRGRMRTAPADLLRYTTPAGEAESVPIASVLRLHRRADGFVTLIVVDHGDRLVKLAGVELAEGPADRLVFVTEDQPTRIELRAIRDYIARIR